MTTGTHLVVFLSGWLVGRARVNSKIVLWPIHVVNKITYNEISLGQTKPLMSSSWSEAMLKQF